MSRSAHSGGGLSFAEGIAKGRYVITTVSRDVLDAYKSIERDFPRLRCWWDNENKEHVVVEHCTDGSISIVLTSPHFVEDLIRLQIHRADSTKFDPLKEIEESEKQFEKYWDDRLHDQIGDAGERLAFAFAQDGLTVRPKIAFNTRMHRKRTLPNFEAPTRTMSNR